jgi:hypothetical protein
MQDGDTPFVGLRPDLTLTIESEGAVVWKDDRELADLEAEGAAGPALAALWRQIAHQARPIQELVGTLAEHGVPRRDTLTLLEQLGAAGLLYSYSNPDDAAAAARYSPHASRPQVVLDQVRASPIALLGDSVLSRAVARALDGCGFECVQRVERPGSTGAFAPDLTVIVAFDLPPEDALGVNLYSLEHGVPLLPGWGSRYDVHFGPVIVPGRGPCLSCMIGPAGRFHGWTSLEPGALAGNPGMIGAAAHMAAGILFDFLAEPDRPEDLRNHRRFGLRDGSVRDVTVLRNPRCEACGRLQAFPEGGAALGASVGA